MARFPDFFEEVVGPLVNLPIPGLLSQEEQAGITWPEGTLAPVADLPGSGPPVWVIHAGDDEDDLVTEIEIPAPPETAEAAGAEEGTGPSGRFSEDGSPGVDVVAAYKPWHIWGDDWGIYFYATAVRDFGESIAAVAGRKLWEVEAYVMHQLLEHELVHFEFEVVGAELEAIHERPLYRSYLFNRFRNRSRWTEPPWPPPGAAFPGPVEEAIATWREVVFARKKSNPAGFQKAVRVLADAAPPGYNAWRCMKDRDRRADLVTATVASLIADQSQPTWPWGDVTEIECLQVPRYWRGDPRLLPGFIVPKGDARPTPRALERWLKQNGAVIDSAAGKGSHRKFTWRGQTGGYATSRTVVPKNESQQIARIFGLENATALHRAIAGRVKVG